MVAFNDFQEGGDWASEFKKSICQSLSENLSIKKAEEIPAEMRKIMIDITVEYINPLGFPENGGLRTSNFVNECLNYYPALRPQVLLFKWTMSIWGLNKTYTGNFLVSKSWP